MSNAMRYSLRDGCADLPRYNLIRTIDVCTTASGDGWTRLPGRHRAALVGGLVNLY